MSQVEDYERQRPRIEGHLGALESLTPDQWREVLCRYDEYAPRDLQRLVNANIDGQTRQNRENWLSNEDARERRALHAAHRARIEAIVRAASLQIGGDDYQAVGQKLLHGTLVRLTNLMFEDYWKDHKDAARVADTARRLLHGLVPGE